jgi:hypothetical protein
MWSRGFWNRKQTDSRPTDLRGIAFRRDFAAQSVQAGARQFFQEKQGKFAL